MTEVAEAVTEPFSSARGKPTSEIPERRGMELSWREFFLKLGDGTLLSTQSDHR